MRTSGKDEINRLCAEYLSISTDTSCTDLRKAKENELFIFVFKMCNNEEANALGVFWEHDWHLYDPEKSKGNFFSFVNERLKLRNIDMGKEIKAGTKKVVSLDECLGDGENNAIELFDFINDEPAQIPFMEIGDNEQGVRLLLLAVQFLERNSFRARKAQHMMYYFRPFFTESVKQFFYQSKLIPEAFINHEAELISVLKKEFLDFISRSPSETLQDLHLVPLKLYGELVEGRTMEKAVGLPLPNDAFVAYMNRVENNPVGSESTITNQRNQYKEIMKEIFNGETDF